MDISGLAVIVQRCREQVQKERERRMTPKLGEALEALKKLRSFAEFEGGKLTKRINEEAEPLLIEAFKGAHGAIDGLRDGVQDIADFCEEMKQVGSNGGDPLDTSSEQSGQSVPPRSSEVATK